LNEVCADLPPYVKTHLSDKISRENASTIIEYVEALKTETNLSIFYKQAVIDTFTTLAKFHHNGGGNGAKSKSFKNMTRDDIVAFLNRLRKSEEQDRKHRWIGTYNQNVIHLNRFFKLLHYPLVDRRERPRSEVMQNITKLRRKEESNYEGHELWLDPDCNHIFLRYCPVVRDRAFHAMMLDTSSRPKELMNARIEDVQFIDEGYSQRIAIVRVVGKCGKRIKKMLYKSLPYLKDWLSAGNHPMPDNPQAYLFCGLGFRNRGRKLERHHFSHMYHNYKIYFKSLLNSPDVSAEDKKIIEEKMLTKPWRPYVLSYTSLTEKAANGELSEYQLREQADWTLASNMPKKYLRFRGDESIKALMRARGIVAINPEGKENNNNAETESALAPTIICYNCKEPNKPGSRICSNPKCKMIISYEAQNKMIQDAENVKKQVELLNQEYARMNEMLTKTTSTMSSMVDMFEDAHNNENGQQTGISKQKYAQYAVDALSTIKSMSGLNKGDFAQIWFEALKGDKAEMKKKLMQARGDSKSITKENRAMLTLMEDLAKPLRDEVVVKRLKEYDELVAKRIQNQ
jgi:integrase/recombinase XerD